MWSTPRGTQRPNESPASSCRNLDTGNCSLDGDVTDYVIESSCSTNAEHSAENLLEDSTGSSPEQLFWSIKVDKMLSVLLTLFVLLYYVSEAWHIFLCFHSKVHLGSNRQSRQYNSGDHQESSLYGCRFNDDMSPNWLNLRFCVKKVKKIDQLKELKWLVDLIRPKKKDCPKK